MYFKSRIINNITREIDSKASNPVEASTVVRRLPNNVNL